MSDAADFEAELLAQMRQDFLIESQEILERLGPLLVQLEQAGAQGSNDPNLLQAIFREMHTLKGTAGFVGLSGVQVLAHKLEDVFGALRGQTLAVTAAVIDLTFAGVELLAAMREDAARGGEGAATGSAELLAHLDALLHPATTPKAAVAPPAVEAIAPQPAASETADEKPGNQEPLRECIPPLETPQAPTLAPAGDSTLRIPTETLDRMMELVGELITARNALHSFAEQSRDEKLLTVAAAISRLTHDLQGTVTSVRLVPVEKLFQRFTAVLRNTGRECGKAVKLTIEGGDTPLDRSISEQMYDPLIHLLRNAVDHGIEPPDERLRLGKPETGEIRLSAERRGDDVILRVSDDGGGIDPERVRSVAVERKLYSEEEARALSDEQILQAIFMSGFSTASQVTDLSGRGVGLDVVVQHVQRLRGSVSIETAPGRGTTFVIQLPLTLAILQVQLVQVGQFIYAIPLHLVRETLLIEPQAIQEMQRRQVIFVHNAPLPLRNLADCGLGGPDKEPSGGNGREPATTVPGQKRPALVVRLTGRQEVLAVDELVGKQQVVIKPLSPYLGAVKGVDGAAILPNGAVTLILNLEELLKDAEARNVERNT